jgi:hypothetical protein
MIYVQSIFLASSSRHSLRYVFLGFPFGTPPFASLLTLRFGGEAEMSAVLLRPMILEMRSK